MGEQKKPMSGWAWYFYVLLVMGVGATYGAIAHKVFEQLYSSAERGQSGLMLFSFLGGVPFVMGMGVAWWIKRKRSISFGAALSTSFIPVLLLVFIGGAVLREGFICLLMATPLFLLIGLIGSAIGWVISAMVKDKSPKLFGAALFVPFLLGGAETQMEPSDVLRQVKHDVWIAAPAATVWRHINNPTDIQPSELTGGVAYRMGVPYPIEARTLTPRVGGLRQLNWQHGVFFKEQITAYEENRLIAWKYLFTPDSFPDGSLDDHIKIGGRYFDLVDTAYTLTEEQGGTRLGVLVSYRVSTSFNWYAVPWANFLIADTAQTILGFYKVRSERSSIAMQLKN